MRESDASSQNRKRFRRRKPSITSISTVLTQVAGKFGLERRMKEHALMSVWFDVVDEPFKNCSRPLFYDHDGNLVVSVRDASVAQELSFQRHELVKRLFPFARAIGLKINGVRFDLKHFRELEAESSSAEALLSRQNEKILPSLPEDDQLFSQELDDESSQELSQLKENLQAAGNSHEIDARIMRIYERELRLKVWKEANALPGCSACGYRERRLFGEQQLCGHCHIIKRLSSFNKVED